MALRAPVAVFGAGHLGLSWAGLFCCAGFQVYLLDQGDRAERALTTARARPGSPLFRTDSVTAADWRQCLQELNQCRWIVWAMGPQSDLQVVLENVVDPCSMFGAEYGDRPWPSPVGTRGEGPAWTVSWHGGNALQSGLLEWRPWKGMLDFGEMVSFSRALGKEALLLPTPQSLSALQLSRLVAKCYTLMGNPESLEQSLGIPREWLGRYRGSLAHPQEWNFRPPEPGAKGAQATEVCRTFCEHLRIQKSNLVMNSKAARKLDFVMKSAHGWLRGPFEFCQQSSSPAPNDRLTCWSLLKAGQGWQLRNLGSQVLALILQRQHVDSLAIDAYQEAFDLLQSSRWLGLVCLSAGLDFSVGADLRQVAADLDQRKFTAIERRLERFQALTQRLRSSSKPIVLSLNGYALGAGCELALQAQALVTTTYVRMGLVESLVGLLPAGGGLTELATRANSESEFCQFFAQVISGQISNSAYHANKMGYLRWDREDRVTTGARRIDEARAKVLSLSARGPSPLRDWATIWCAQDTLQARVDPLPLRDRAPAQAVVRVLLAGRMGERVSRQTLLERERQEYLSLLGRPETKTRIATVLSSMHSL
ncbi:enoyl-CoA hydratase/isomerase family protein [bacterium]|nr:enoyl-CoA hydratase/isomerase family protein [bacterium]